MISPSRGFASVRGRGESIRGGIYQFSGVRWNPLFEFPYSDSPLLAVVDSGSVWTVNHLIHTGNCQPIVCHWFSSQLHESAVPKLMWDKTDYAILTGISFPTSMDGWMVGQQGHILRYHDAGWKEEATSIGAASRSNVYEGDLTDVQMLTPTSGWAIGKNGIILRYQNGKWKKYASPTQHDLFRVSIVDERHGWIVGDNGTVLQWNGEAWNIFSLDLQTRLNSVRALDTTHAYIVGNNSTFYVFDGTAWHANESIKMYDDILEDVDVVRDSSNQYRIWIIGDHGIYTNSQTIGFSFTDITNSAGLRKNGRGGMFVNADESEFPDLLVVGDAARNFLFTNTRNNHFHETTIDGASVPTEVKATALGDMNNDGVPDILDVLDQGKFHLAFGKHSGAYRAGIGTFIVTRNDSVPINSVAVRLADFDNDGNLDVYVSNENGKDMLFRSDGAGIYTDVFDSSGIEKMLKHHSFGATFGDFNNDGRIDVVIPYWISERGKFLDLFLNDGNFHFHASRDSMFLSSDNILPDVCIAADFNNDGNLDLLIHCQNAPPKMLMNDGHAHFRDASTEMGFTTTLFTPDPGNGILAAGDVNNDGWIDVFMVSKLFLNQHGKRFVEVSEQSGIQFLGHPSFADIDNDGDLDLFLGSAEGSLGSGDRAALYRNNLNNGSFIKVRVQGDISNRMAIGAKVFVEATDDHATKQLRIVGLGSNPMLVQDVSEVHFGVDPQQQYQVRVVFPSGRERVMEQVRAGTILTIQESPLLSRAATLSLKSIAQTVHKIPWSVACIQLFFILLILLGFYSLGQKFHTTPITARWYFYVGIVAIYLFALHHTVEEGILISSLASLGALTVSGSAVLAVARVAIQRHEAKYLSHYKLLDVLGCGGMGKVFKAIDVNTKQLVALKILHPEIVHSQENRKRLLAEGEMLRSISHPHVVRILEVADTGETAFVSMELLTGGTLKELLEHEHPMQPATILKILLEVCDGLAEIHAQNIIHRDLKTGNIMLDAEHHIRIMDFGLSKSPLVTTMTSLGTVLGTLGYVAPEQITNQLIDHRTDIFSLGVVMYELLTKTLPFQGENEIALIHSIFNITPPPPSQCRTDISIAWDAIVSGCLAKNMSERFSTVAQVQEALQALE